MISKFKILHKKNDLDEKKNFQNQIFDFLTENYPNYNFKKSDNPLLILCDENELGLSNLYNNFLLSSQTNYELKQLAEEHFEKVLSFKELFSEEMETWDETKSQIFPQLMPIEFKNEFSVLSLPFADEVAVGFVVDGEKAYRYVISSDLESWEVDISEIERNAIENLLGISSQIEMTYVPPPTAMVVINTMDSFDAVRILDPSLREFLTEKLGKSFFFGIPNRDFLICWSKNADSEFQKTVINQISTDFDERPYPLSRNTFELSENGEILLSDFEQNRNDQMNLTSNN